MKEIIIDCILVCLVLFLFNSLFNDNNIEKHMFKKDIVEFEELLDLEKEYQEEDSNFISRCVLKISQACITIIETFILLISQFISKLI